MLFFQGWKEPRQVEVEAAEEDLGRGGGRGGDPGLLEPFPDKVVDGVARPAFGHADPCDGLEGPVPLIGSALFDPAAEEGHFGFGEGSALGFGRRHELGGVLMPDPGEELTLIGLAGNDGGISPEVGEGLSPQVEAQVCLPFLLVRPVAEKAFVGENGTDVAIELDVLRGGRGGEQDEKQHGRKSGHGRIREFVNGNGGGGNPGNGSQRAGACALRSSALITLQYEPDRPA